MVTAIVAIVAGAALVAAIVVARRRRIQIERFAALAGVRRMPGESLDSLLERSVRRFRVIAPAHGTSLVADEPIVGGDVVSLDLSNGMVRRAAR